MRTQTLLLTFLCTLASACGGGAAGDVDSGLPAEKKVSELTPSEQETLCRASAENLAAQASESELKRYGCILGAAFVAAGSDDPVAACEAFVPMCLDAPAEGEGGGTDTCMLTVEATTCQATVGEFEACLTEQNETFGAAVREASCDDFADQTGEPAEPVAGPACTKIKTTCPGTA